LKNSQPFRKSYQKTLGGKIFRRTLYINSSNLFDLTSYITAVAVMLCADAESIDDDVICTISRKYVTNNPSSYKTTLSTNQHIKFTVSSLHYSNSDIYKLGYRYSPCKLDWLLY